MKELKEYGQEWIPKLKSKSSKQTSNRSEIQKIATEYYKALYSNNDTTHVNEISCQTNTTEPNNVPSILPQEVQKSIMSQKLDKAPGPDNITNKLIKENIEIVPILTKMFNDILTTGYIPSQWNISDLILLHKKGDKDDISNYRPISLISNV